jgi:sugar phosphate permease
MRHKAFHGWWIVAVAALGVAFGPSTILFFSLGILMKPLETDLGWTRAQVSVSLSILTFGFIFSLPVVGRVTDAIGVRRVVLPSILVFGLCVIGLSFVQQLWMFYALFAAISLLCAGTNSPPYIRALSSWFVAHRGLAFGICMTGLGVGAAIVPLVTQYAIEWGGWRLAYRVLGGGVVLIELPLIFFLLRNTPQEMGLLPDGGVVSHESAVDQSWGLNLRAALLTRQFWLLLIVFFMVSGALNGVVVHLVPLLTDKGITVGAAVWIASLLGVSVAFGHLITGALIDRVFAPYVAAVLFALAALGITVLTLSGSTTVAYASAVLVGLATGADGDMLGYLCSRYFGLKSFCELYGYLLGGYLLGLAVYPLAMSLLLESTHSYRTALLLCAASTLLGAALISSLGSYAQPEAAAPGRRDLARA